MILKRSIFILAVTLISLGCLVTMNFSYDPLSRYPYELTEEEHNRIVENLSSKQIDYIIEYAISPTLFIDFLGIDGYNIYFADIYHDLYEEYQDYTDREMIVHFYNIIYKKFGKLPEGLLENYHFHEITEYYQQYPDASAVEVFAASVDTVVDYQNSVGFYTPKNLTTIDILTNKTIRLDQRAYDALVLMVTQMKQDVNESSMNQLSIIKGYCSYEDVMKENKQAGTDNFQLGLSVQFVFDKTLDCLQWLKNNAYQYGYVQYSHGTENHWRYIGIELAGQLHDTDQTMEEYAYE